MKHERTAFLIILMLLTAIPCCAEPALGDRGTGAKTDKTGQGLKDMLLGWTEIPSAIARVTHESNNPLWGLTAGTLQGIAAAFPKTVGGAVELSAPRNAPAASAQRE